MPGRDSYGPGGKWIHNRAHGIMDKRKSDLMDRYGEEKGKQIAYALATQQAHKVGKSPKGFRTTQGVHQAKSKLDKPVKEYQKTAALGIGVPIKEYDPGPDKSYRTNIGLSFPHGPTLNVRAKRGIPISENTTISPGLGLGLFGPHIGLNISPRDKAYEQLIADKKKARAEEKKEKKAAAVDESVLLAFFDEMEQVEKEAGRLKSALIGASMLAGLGAGAKSVLPSAAATAAKASKPAVMQTAKQVLKGGYAGIGGTAGRAARYRAMGVLPK